MAYLMHDQYGSSGIHPNHSQQAINLQFASDNINDEFSPYGPKKGESEKVPGFTPVYSLKKTDDPIDTVRFVGLEDSPVGRITLDGLPVPEEYRPKNNGGTDEAAYMDWTDEHLAFQGVTEPMTDAITMDTKRTFRVIVNGATDVIVNEDVQAGDTLVWRPINKKRKLEKETVGSLLERMNPNTPDVVPLNKEYFSKSLGGITASVVRGLDKTEFGRVKAQAGQRDDQTLDALFDKIRRVNPNDSDYSEMTRSKRRQVCRVLMFLENAVKLNEAINDYIEIRADASNGEKDKALSAISVAAGSLAQNVGSHYTDISSHKLGRALKNAKGGFTTFMMTNTGSS